MLGNAGVPKTDGRGKRKFDSSEQTSNSRFKRAKVCHVETEEQVKEEESNDLRFNQYGCYRVGDDSDESENFVSCKIGGVALSMLIDSGSKYNLLTESDWNRLVKGKAELWNIRNQTSTVLTPYASKFPMKIKCVFEAPIHFGSKEVMASFFVIEKGNETLLGRLSAIKLDVLRLGPIVNCVKEIKKFPCITGIKVQLYIDRQIKPVVQPAVEFL